MILLGTGILAAIICRLMFGSAAATLEYLRGSTITVRKAQWLHVRGDGDFRVVIQNKSLWPAKVVGIKSHCVSFENRQQMQTINPLSAVNLSLAANEAQTRDAETVVVRLYFVTHHWLEEVDIVVPTLGTTGRE